MSKLLYTGHKKFSDRKKSAIIAFSTEEVYAIAELMKTKRWGRYNGLSKSQTRNAQVNLYQSGDVDYLVATDAIGMGIIWT